MNGELISILTELGKENGSEFFINRIIFRNLMSKYYDDSNNEHRLLIKISNTGYLAKITKNYSSNEEKIRIINTLYDDESIDKVKATDYVETLSKIIENVINFEKEINEKDKKIAEEKAKQEIIKEKQQLENVIYNSLVNIIKYKGIDTLNNYDYCRAYLKDMANGDYVDQITSISLMLKNNMHGIILKKRLFRINKADLIKIIKKSNVNYDILLISLLIDAITNASNPNGNERGGKNWITNLLKH